MDIEILEYLETLFRGAAAGICLFMVGRFVRFDKLARTENFAAIFAFATAGYAIVSTPNSEILPEPVFLFLSLLGALNSVFFWWLASALLQDGRVWQAFRWIPFAFMLGLYGLSRFSPAFSASGLDVLLQKLATVSLMLHSLWLALANYKHDLLDRRRTFRIVLATVIGGTGIVIAIVELWVGQGRPDVSLTLLHAIVLTVLAFLFATWTGQTIDDYFIEPPKVDQKPESNVLDDAMLDRLERFMLEGGYKQERLSIGLLASKLGYPEYVLRRLINQSLGFRNFNEFLNKYRIDQAVRELSDPEQLGRQVTGIAYELGYGSLATFNRAFKAQTGKTPSQFRKDAHAPSQDAV